MATSISMSNVVSNGQVELERLPQPDYQSHPAYGGAFPAPSLGLRLKALSVFMPWFFLVLAKRALLFDRLPPLPDYDGPISDSGVVGRLMVMPRYLPLIGRGFVDQARKLAGARKMNVSGEGAKMLETFRRDGIVVTSLDDEEMKALKVQIAQPLNELLRKREQASGRTFESNQSWLNRRDASALYAMLDQMLACHEILSVAGAYLGRPVSVKHLLLQVNDHQDRYAYNKLADVGLPDSATNYMHVDTSYDTLKCAIYLNEVDEGNGPFCYVRGSSRLKVTGLEGLVRRATDRSGLSGYSRPTRELFAALPASLRKKCTFGSDLLDGTAEAKALLAAEYRFVSADGNLGMFDNEGVHRGALVSAGNRQVLFVTLA